MEWVNLTQMNINIYYCGQESLRRNGVAITVNKKVGNEELGCHSQKWQNDLCSFPRQTIQYNITVIQVYVPASNAEEAEVEQFYEDLQDLLELTLKKDVLFIIEGWNAKVEGQETPWVTGRFGLGVQNEAGQRLTEFCQENALVMANSFPTTQETTLHVDINKWSIPKSDWLCSLQPKMEKLYTVSKSKTWSWLWLRSLVPYYKIQA